MARPHRWGFVVFAIFFLIAILYNSVYLYHDPRSLFRELSRATVLGTINAVPLATTTISTSLPGPLSTDLPIANIDWTRFAYIQYVTAPEFLCNSVMAFEALDRLGSKADRVLMYPKSWGKFGTSGWQSLEEGIRAMLLKAKKEYRVNLMPVDLLTKQSHESTWESSFTKLIAWNATSYSRVIAFDSDSTVLQPLDDLFLLPSTPLAIPRAYWLIPDPIPERTIIKYPLTSMLLVVSPDTKIFEQMLVCIRTKAQSNDYDMEIVNWMFGPEAMILPHRGWALLSGEFRRDRTIEKEHSKVPAYDRYLGNAGEKWDAKSVIKEARLVHFSDWPRPKPWYYQKPENVEITPKCYNISDGKEDCTDKEVWEWLYEDFKQRRKYLRSGIDGPSVVAVSDSETEYYNTTNATLENVIRVLYFAASMDTQCYQQSPRKPGLIP